MEGTPAIYLGRIIDKQHFRAFIYAPNGNQRLVESWEEFEANMQTGVWFATHDEAIASVITKNGESKSDEKLKAKPKSKSKTKLNPIIKVEVEDVTDSEDILEENGSVFEVTDDFLPKKEGE